MACPYCGTMVVAVGEATETQEITRQEPREWSLDKNGVIVSKPIEQESQVNLIRRYDMSGPGATNPNHIFKCGTHDYETKSLTEFNQHIASHDHSSKAASVPAVNEVKELFDFLNGRFE